MATKTKYTLSTRRRNGIAGTPTVQDYNMQVEHQVIPKKTSGAVIKLSNSSIFRRATDRSLSMARIGLGTPQQSTGTYTYDGKQRKALVETSPGGYGADILLRTSALADNETGFSVCTSPPNLPLYSKNEASTKALLKLADSKANLGESLGTLSQTLKMIGKPTKFVFDGISSILRDKSLRRWSNYSRSRLKELNIIDETASRYLEYVYGWKPAMQEIYGLIEYAQEKGDLPLLLNGRGSASRTTAVSANSVWNSSKGSYTDFSGTSVSKTRCSLWAQIDPNYAGIRALNQLGLANPLATAWELVTLSFVVDWFVPIGPMLHAWTAPAGLKLVDGSYGHRVTLSGTYSNSVPMLPSNTSVDQHSPATGTLHYEGYTRNRINVFPQPGFWFDPDPLRGDRSLKAIALMITRMAIR